MKFAKSRMETGNRAKRATVAVENTTSEHLKRSKHEKSRRKEIEKKLVEGNRKEAAASTKGIYKKAGNKRKRHLKRTT